MHSLNVPTNRRCEMLDVTSQVARIVADSGITTGLVRVFVPHTTAGVTINENADPDVVHDILLTLGQMVPEHNKDFRHCEGNSDAHCKSSLFGCSQQVLVKNRSLVLGTWQAIFFCEFDGPRNRQVIVQIRGE